MHAQFHTLFLTHVYHVEVHNTYIVCTWGHVWDKHRTERLSKIICIHSKRFMINGPPFFKKLYALTRLGNRPISLGHISHRSLSAKSKSQVDVTLCRPLPCIRMEVHQATTKPGPDRQVFDGMNTDQGRRDTQFAMQVLV